MRRINVTAESNSLTLDKSPVHGGETDPPIDDAGHLLLHHHFDDMAQQRECNTLMMWCFLATEIMMFGGLFCAYAVYRWSFPHAWAIGSHHIKWFMGSVNTGVLLVSSLTMAMAVHSAALRNKRRLVGYLVATLVLGVAFIGIKGVEWTQDYYEGLAPGVQWNYYDTTIHPDHAKDVAELAKEGVSPNAVKMFMVFYFFMTGLHGFHMLVGIILVSVLLVMAIKGRFTEGNDQPVEISGLYWHLIDIIWIFLFPLLYLVSGIKGSGPLW
jgi:cytochrome c oxidase subunit 3